MRLIWATDIHLDACGLAGIRRFLACVAAEEPDIFVITGDISTGTRVMNDLLTIIETCEPQFLVYFVLGNHDFYGLSVSAVRSQVKDRFFANYLSVMPHVPLSGKIALVGHDSWADGVYGSGVDTPPQLNDFSLIEDLKRVRGEELVRVLGRLADESVDKIVNDLESADADDFIIATHVPPYEDVARLSNKVLSRGVRDLSAFFGNSRLEKALEDFFTKNPSKRGLVLSGHVHHNRDIRPLPNLRVITKHADYGGPAIAMILNFEDSLDEFF